MILTALAFTCATIDYDLDDRIPIIWPVAMLAEKIDEETVQVMVVVVMRLRENANRGTKLADELD